MTSTAAAAKKKVSSELTNLPHLLYILYLRLEATVPLRVHPVLHLTVAQAVRLPLVQIPHHPVIPILPHLKNVKRSQHQQMPKNLHHQ